MCREARDSLSRDGVDLQREVDSDDSLQNTVNVRRVTVGYNSMGYYLGREPGGVEKRDRGSSSWTGKYRAKAAKDKHRHSPAKMRYSRFVHYVQNYRQTPRR